MTKSMFSSKTIWFNIIAGIAPIIISQLGGSVGITAEEQAALLAVGNLVLRFFTTQPIAVKAV